MVKNLPVNAGDAGDMGSIPGLGRSSREGNGNPLQYSCLENNSMDRGAMGCSSWGHKESDMTEHTQPCMRDCFFFCHATRLVGS